MKEMVCICCPRGCHLVVDDDLNVTGNTCPRGAEYGKNEVLHPVRILTSTVRVANREDVVASVKTVPAIPKGKMFEVMKEIDQVRAKAPLHIGDVVIHDVLGLGSDVVVTKETK